jgi:NAD(P)-dependent dehydrogenase (short-subunit alcohol dehydrogenase family)
MERAMQTILITGANTGIGAACAVAMAGPDVHLVLACRSAEKTAPVLEAVRAAGAKATFHALDLSDVKSAAAAGRDLAAQHGKLDLLINNAGLAGQRGTTRDGWELAFGVNHLGHFAFTLPLLPALEAASGRIVNVSSGNHHQAKAIPWSDLSATTRSYTGLPEYAVSKLCNVLFTAELRRRYPRITSVSMNPGPIVTDIFRRMPAPLFALLKLFRSMATVEVGGARLKHAATVEISGDDAPLYIDRDTPRPVNPVGLREDLATELWDFSLRAIAA